MMVYEGNPKHKNPWQPGRKGSLCPSAMSIQPQKLLEQSILLDGKRYATCDGQCFCAQEHEPDRWHGYPVGWHEAPEQLRRAWKDEGKIRKNDINKFW